LFHCDAARDEKLEAQRGKITTAARITASDERIA